MEDHVYSGACLRQLFLVSQERLTSHMCRRKLAESSDDEEHFQRKEEKRLARDKARLNPVILSKLSTPTSCFREQLSTATEQNF